MTTEFSCGIFFLIIISTTLLRRGCCPSYLFLVKKDLLVQKGDNPVFRNCMLHVEVLFADKFM